MKLHFGVGVLGTMLPTAMVFGGAIDSTSGLLYNLDASAGVTADGSNKVSSWQSQFATTPTFTQATTAKQPTLFAGTAGTINGLPYIRFDGDISGNSGGIAPNADELIYATSSAPRTVFIVNRLNANTGFAAIWGSEGADTGIRRVSAGTSWSHPGNANDFTNTGSFFVNGDTNLAVGTNTWHIVAATTGASPTYAQTSIGDYFRSGTVTPRSFNGDIAEVVVYNRVLSAAERQAIELELGEKYGIAVVPEPAGLTAFAAAAAGLLIARRRLQH
jgi:hypothetical protein